MRTTGRLGEKSPAPRSHYGARPAIPGGSGTPVEIWRDWCVDVRGQAIDCGHFLAEEAPAETLAALIPFLQGEGKV